MKCGKCGAEIPDDSQYCNVCGTKIDVNLKCDKCGVDIPKESQFCNACGTKIDLSSIQRKDTSQNESIKPVQETPITKNVTKRSIFSVRNIVLVTGGIIGVIVILIVLIFLLAVIVEFNQGMQSTSNSVQTGNSNQGSSNHITPTSNVAEQAALSDYNAKISIANIAGNTLSSYSSNTHTFVDLNDYKSWIDGYKQYLDSYTSKADDEIAAGETYKQYLTMGSDGYNNMVNNDAIINNNIQTDTNYYNQLISDYNKKLATQNAANDYQNKLNTVASTSKDLQNYANTSGLFSSLSSTWVDGYGDKVTAYANACDQAINSGNTYQQYLDPSSQNYATVSKNAQILTDSENQCTESYTKLKKGNEDLSSILGLVKYLPLLGA